jgi:hypothetical protein
MRIFLAASFDQLNGAGSVPRLGMQAQLWRLFHKIAYSTPLDGRIIDYYDRNRIVLHGLYYITANHAT